MKRLPEWTRRYRKVGAMSGAVTIKGQTFVQRDGTRWYHLGVTDRKALDGVTLVTVYPVLSPRILKAIRRTIRRGHVVVMPKGKLSRRDRRKLGRLRERDRAA